MRVVTLCGSHQIDSTNAIVLAAIVARLAAAGAEVDSVDDDLDVPAFRPHLVDSPSPPVAKVRAQFEAADAVVFAIPEYAGGLPGWVKNITDWMVGSGSLYERPVAVVSAATGGGARAIEQLAQTLTWQGAHVIATCSVAAPLTKIGDGEVTDPATCADLAAVADSVIAALGTDRDGLVAMAGRVLAPLGIEQFDRR